MACLTHIIFGPCRHEFRTLILDDVLAFSPVTRKAQTLGVIVLMEHPMSLLINCSVLWYQRPAVRHLVKSRSLKVIMLWVRKWLRVMFHTEHFLFSEDPWRVHLFLLYGHLNPVLCLLYACIREARVLFWLTHSSSLSTFTFIIIFLTIYIILFLSLHFKSFFLLFLFGKFCLFTAPCLLTGRAVLHILTMTRLIFNFPDLSPPPDLSLCTFEHLLHQNYVRTSFSLSFFCF